MRFGEVHSIKRSKADDWFDPFLDFDTRLFVDPFRIWLEGPSSEWQGAHDRLIAFFNLVLSLIAKSDGNRQSAHFLAARRLLMFPEPSEFCLGFGQETTLGSGSGRGFQRGMLEGALAAIQLDLPTLEHFEEMVLFQEGIGADRVSDITCNVLKREFVAYTAKIAKRHKLEVAPIKVPHADWSAYTRNWIDGNPTLPRNPLTGRAVLLTPERFLRELPSVDPDDFWDWAWANIPNADIRGSFNYDIAIHVDAPMIARFARSNPDIAAAYLGHLEDSPKPAYDLERDPMWKVKWYELGKKIASEAPLALIASSPGQFCDFVGEIVKNFAHYVEEQDGWLLLWNGNRSASERRVQALFRGVVISYCQANDIDLSGEANAGRGPVDFKFSQGWQRRALVEIKLAKNSKYWHGLTVQTPQYLRSDDVGCGYFVSVGFGADDFKKERQDDVRNAAKSLSDQHGVDLRPVFIDASKKESASKAKPKGTAPPKRKRTSGGPKAAQ